MACQMGHQRIKRLLRSLVVAIAILVSQILLWQVYRPHLQKYNIRYSSGNTYITDKVVSTQMGLAQLCSNTVNKIKHRSTCCKRISSLSFNLDSYRTYIIGKHMCEYHSRLGTSSGILSSSLTFGVDAIGENIFLSCNKKWCTQKSINKCH